MIDPFKYADTYEDKKEIEEYQKNFKEDAKKIIEEMELCLQQKNEDSTSEAQISQQ